MSKGTGIGICIGLTLFAAAIGLQHQIMSPEPPAVPKAPVVLPRPETVVYSRLNGEDLSLDVYLPHSPRLKAAILLLHGGGWVSGSRADMAELAESVARQGMVAVSADYRLAPKHRWPAQLEDVQTAVRYIRANAHRLNIDPENIAAVGISAGGQLSLFLGSVEASHPKEYPGVSSRVAAVGSISGLHDLRLKMTPKGETYGIVEALTGSREGPTVSAASPILVTTHKSAPTYFIQGAADPLVPANQIQLAAKRLSDLGVPEKAETVPGMGHGLNLKAEPESQAFANMLGWIYLYLPHAGHFDSVTGPVRASGSLGR